MRAYVFSLLLGVAAAADNGYFSIQVIDEETGRGVPLVELQTVNNIPYYTDSNGIVAFSEPGLMGKSVFFRVKSHGYEYPKDRFGFRGRTLKVTPGGSAEIKIKRLNIAERLYRVTGAGIYRDTILAGLKAPITQPLLNARVLGSDSVVNAIYKGRIYWFWGDTNRAAHPLGNFHVPGATSLLPSEGGLDPNVGVELSYFVNENGFAKETARMPGEGPTWINGLVALTDGDGNERMFAGYVKVRKFLEVYERGLVEFNDEEKRFEKVVEFDLDAPAAPHGHPFKRAVDGVEYVYFADPYPLTRVRAGADDLKDLSRYESFTCLRPASKRKSTDVDRAEDGTVRYGWKRATARVGPAEQGKLIEEGKLKPEEALLHLQDIDAGEPVFAHRGTVYPNEHRKRWVMIATQSGGTSALGEVWYAEADTSLGPWVYARKIVTHERYSFYNPKRHPMFDQDGGRIIFFEGTYTRMFSGNPEPTPRYNYNQIMYRLDLADPRLALPAPVYEWRDEDGRPRLGTLRDAPRAPADRTIAFFALDRPAPGSVPVPGEGDEPLFYALPADGDEPPAATVPLYELVAADGAGRTYSIEASPDVPGHRRSAQPLFRVWRNPTSVRLADE